MYRYFLSILTVVVLIFGWWSHQKLKNQKDIITYTLEGKQYKLLVADSPDEWEKGLMHVTKKDGFDGMIFLFPDKQLRTFWNKNTFVSLTLYWLDNDIIIGSASLPSITKSKEIVAIVSPKEVNRVVELIQ